MVLVNDTLTLDSSNVIVNHNGYVVFNDVKIANSGNIQVYRSFELGDLPEELQYKREIKIYRPADEDFKGL